MDRNTKQRLETIIINTLSLLRESGELSQQNIKEIFKIIRTNPEREVVEKPHVPRFKPKIKFTGVNLQ